MEAPEYFAGNAQFTPEKNGKDHFIVEDLFDFTTEEVDANDDGAGGAEEEAGFESAAGNSTESSTVTAVDSCNSSFSGGEQQLSGENPTDAGDLCEPYDELAELEWLSNFVEESFSSEDLKKLQLISGVQSSTSSAEATRVNVHSLENNITDQPTAAEALFLPETSSVPGKARSKRSRAAPSNWSSRLLVLSPNAAAATAAGALSSSDTDTDTAALLNLPKKSRKTPKKCEPPSIVGPTLALSEGRRCLHCATDKTPQWRTGPMGPKTLCNACGVRYKSGRLVPEYRPASSPTFVLSKHSNSHRKVLELRRQKEIQHPLLQIGSSVYDGGSVTASGDDFLIHHNLGPDFRQLI